MKWIAPIVLSVLFACSAESQPPVSGELRLPSKNASAPRLTLPPDPSPFLTVKGQLLPQGLTCGLSYIDKDVIIQEKNTCNGFPTMQYIADGGTGKCYSGYPGCLGCDCIGSPNITCMATTWWPNEPYPDPHVYMCYARFGGVWIDAGPGYTRIWDNDAGLGYTPGGNSYGSWGFWHQELVDGTTDVTLSDSFVLPKGTACGLHATYIPHPKTQNRTCMGYNPAKAFGMEMSFTSLPGCPGLGRVRGSRARKWIAARR